ncbi:MULTISPECIES: N-acetylmuramoyl-L-alanine amidase family protein [Bacteroides]|uniref:N-acetylmuramoyl-L-alanine amidase family protein n=1 Tax=Bacteroides TaxID=816 RepID=UPI001DE3B687|nr:MULTISPECIES: N-acetylmuramoyl-L-alanine amidase [Bacteroides]HJD92704.1 N-acetylmuramoyl-L-alanine amidase [Bacteroides coprosuis]
MKKMLITWVFRAICIFILSTPLVCGTVQAQDQKVIKSQPKAGEGVYEFLLRNKRSLDYYKAFVELNKKRLGKDNSLKLGFYYIIPPKDSINEQTSNDDVVSTDVTDTTDVAIKSAPAQSSSRVGKTITEPLFGAGKQTFKIESDRLKDACFYVVSGHGGPDPGAIGKMGRHHLHEDEYAYDIALRLARNLMIQGAKVHIIIQDAKDGIRDDRILSNSKRETCMGDKIPLDQLSRLKQRTDKINKLYEQDKKKYKYCRAIFLHLDSRSQKKRVDVFFYHYGANAKGLELAETMKANFSSKYDIHQPNRGFSGTVSTRNLYVLKNTSPIALFVELGNIQNSFDQQRFVVSSNRQALAKWMAHGFITDYENQLKK